MKQKVEHIPYVYTDDVVKFESEATYETILEVVKKYVRPGGTILDVGSGRGEMMEKLSLDGYEVCGCDMDDECLRLSARFGKVMKMNIEDISPEKLDDKFDCVLLSHVLEHMENPRETLTRLAGISRGPLIISLPNPYYALFVLRALIGKKPEYMNTGHLQVWDWSHFKTFVEVGCNMQVLEYFSDTVPVPLPHQARILLLKARILPPIENRFLKAIFPKFCRSITAVVKPKDKG